MCRHHYKLLNKALANLTRLRIVAEITAQKRNRLFWYTDYLSILQTGAEPPDS